MANLDHPSIVSYKSQLGKWAKGGVSGWLPAVWFASQHNSKTKGQVPIGLAKLLQVIFERLRPDRCISLEQHQRSVDDLRRESHSPNVPLMVLSLHAYDQSQGTRMAAKAAEAYLSLVNAACYTDDNQAVAEKSFEASTCNC